MGESSLEGSAGGTGVFDSSGLIAFLRAEPGWEIVRDLLEDTRVDRVVHAINLCEVWYDFHRDLGESAAIDAVERLLATGLVVVEDMHADFWQEAGRIKSVRRRVSLADCFCIALARRLDAEVVTADHHEFDAIVPLGLCRIRFIR